jgi:tetratricopeptide (TPR) repeat protein
MFRLFKKWRPSNEPTRYDEARVARLKPIESELEKLGLPLVRFRKLNGILGALEMQIEDGGDHPRVNEWLLEALREGVKHQVGKREARAALRAIDDFHYDEMKRWKRIKAGDLPPVNGCCLSALSQEMRLDDLMQEGYRSQDCDLWLEVWEMIKQMATPQMGTAVAFDDAYPGLTQFVSNWCSDLDLALHNAGLNDPAYHEHRLRYAREFLAQFPDEDANRHVNFLRAQGEALWNLGRRAEAEEVYEGLVEQFPDEAWGYIGWSDNYWLWGAPEPKEYGKAEAILKCALARPDLRYRNDVLERLASLHEEWNASDGPTPPSGAPSPAERLGRNDLCWCGSGKKYKHCHLRNDQTN